jgi:hypothetical protein
VVVYLINLDITAKGKTGKICRNFGPCESDPFLVENLRMVNSKNRNYLFTITRRLNEVFFGGEGC